MIWSLQYVSNEYLKIYKTENVELCERLRIYTSLAYPYNSQCSAIICLLSNLCCDLKKLSLYQGDIHYKYSGHCRLFCIYSVTFEPLYVCNLSMYIGNKMCLKSNRARVRFLRIENVESPSGELVENENEKYRILKPGVLIMVTGWVNASHSTWDRCTVLCIVLQCYV